MFNVSRLMFKFRLGTHGLNEELGWHRGREGMKECLLCDNECESVSNVLWECLAYSSLIDNFLVALQGMSLSISSHSVVSRRRLLCWVVSCGRISVVRYILDVWELRKVRLLLR